MNFKEHFGKLKEPESRTKVLTFLTMLYNFIWAIVKIVFGLFVQSYVYFISGIYTILFGFAKRIFLNNHNKTSNERQKSTIIGVLLLFSGLIFGIYMSTLLFFPHESNFGLILSIAFALCSFMELGIAIFNLSKAHKKDDIMLVSLRCCNLSSGLIAIMLTQIALLSAKNTQNVSSINAITGMVIGFLIFVIAIYVIIKSNYKRKKVNN